MRRACRQAMGIKPNKIVPFPKEKILDYPLQQELYERLLKLVHEYDGELSLATAAGVLGLAKRTIEED